MVECLTRDRGAAGSSLIGITVVSLSRTHLSLLSTGSTQGDPPRNNSKIVEWGVKNHMKQTKTSVKCTKYETFAKLHRFHILYIHAVVHLYTLKCNKSRWVSPILHK